MHRETLPMHRETLPMHRERAVLETEDPTCPYDSELRGASKYNHYFQNAFHDTFFPLSRTVFPPRCIGRPSRCIGRGFPMHRETPPMHREHPPDASGDPPMHRETPPDASGDPRHSRNQNLTLEFVFAQNPARWIRTAAKRLAWSQQPNLYLEPKWLRYP